MKTKTALITIVLFMIIWGAKSQSFYTVSGAGSASVNGNYTESGTANGKPKYVKGTFSIEYSSSDWLILENTDCYYYSTGGNTPPASGWDVCDVFGNYPVPTVRLAVRTVLYSSLAFTESSNNDGSIGNSVTITHNGEFGDFFTGNNGDDFILSGKAVVNNLPAGLTAALIRTSNLTLIFSLNGNAVNHLISNSISNLTLTFADAAFDQGNAAGVVDYQKTFSVNFIQRAAPSGSGSSTQDPYLISSLEHLNWMVYQVNDLGNKFEGKFFRQVQDIDASATANWYDNGAGGYYGWTPIGNGWANPFRGTYDGDWHKISAIYINRPAVGNIGLFGFAQTGSIKNLGMINANITGNNRTGALVGFNAGGTVIRNCFATGSVSGESRIGGLMGDNMLATITEFCYTDVDVSGIEYTGGFAGQSSNSSGGFPIIQDCYSIGNVTRSSGTDHRVAGFIGENYNAVLQRCYSTGRVTSIALPVPTERGFAGQVLDGGPVVNNFWDMETSGQTTSLGATGKSTAEMKTLATFTGAGWDFVGESASGSNENWDKFSTINSNYPFLTWQEPVVWTGAADDSWSNIANWTGSLDVPVYCKNAIIPGGALRNVTVNQPPSAPAICNNLTIDAGAELWIAPGKALTVNGTLTNSGGISGLYLQSDENGTGSLIHNADDVPALVETYITGNATLTENTYHFVSIPAREINPTSNLFLDSYLYLLDPSLQEPTNNNYYGKWVGLGTSTTTPLNLNQGYMIYFPGPSWQYAFSGNLNNGSFHTAVSGHDASNSFNLVPNPYPSSINWQATSGWTKTNIENKFWIFNHGVYASFTGGTTPDSTNGGKRFVVPGQAFIVNATTAAPALSMTNDVRVHASAAFLKSGEEYPDRLTITASCNGMSDEIVVKFNENATAGYDSGFDAIKLSGSADAPNLSTLAGDQQLCINALPLVTGQTIVPMLFETQYTGVVDLNINGSGSFDPSVKISLIDELTGQTINLRNQPFYTFNHGVPNAANHFKLVIGGTSGVEESESFTGNIWNTGNILYINTPKLAGETAVVEVFNAAGQVVFNKQVTLSELTKIPVSLSGFGVIRVTTSKELMVKKGFFR
jgi:hypothetical protein